MKAITFAGYRCLKHPEHHQAGPGTCAATVRDGERGRPCGLPFTQLTTIVYPNLWDRHVWVSHKTRKIRTPKGVIGGEIFRRPVRVGDVYRKYPDKGSKVEWAETEDEFLARVKAKSVPSWATDARIIDAASVPRDRTHRNAFRPGASVERRGSQ